MSAARSSTRTASGSPTVGSCGNPTGLTIVCGLFSSSTVAAGDHVRVTFNGITNPSTPGNYTVNVATTSDTSVGHLPTFNVAAANQLNTLGAGECPRRRRGRARALRYQGRLQRLGDGRHVGRGQQQRHGHVPVRNYLRRLRQRPGGRHDRQRQPDGRQLRQPDRPDDRVRAPSAASTVAAGDHVRVTFNGITNTATPGQLHRQRLHHLRHRGGHLRDLQRRGRQPAQHADIGSSTRRRLRRSRR